MSGELCETFFSWKTWEGSASWQHRWKFQMWLWRSPLQHWLGTAWFHPTGHKVWGTPVPASGLRIPFSTLAGVPCSPSEELERKLSWNAARGPKLVSWTSPFFPIAHARAERGGGREGKTGLACQTRQVFETQDGMSSWPQNWQLLLQGT